MSKTTVANVNKPVSMRSKATVAQNKAKLNSKSQENSPIKNKIVRKRKVSDANIVFDEMEMAEGSGSRSAATYKRKKAVTPHWVETEFVEDEQIVQMEVEAEEETLFQTKSSSSEEKTPEYLDDQASVSDHEITFTERTQSPPQRDKSTKEHIKDIDEEMLLKLEELQQLMTSGGLAASAKALESLKESARQKQAGKMTHKTKISEYMVNKNSNVTNFNGQANRPVIAHHDQSEETIYANAIEKRVSSSSDEIDTSDDFVHAITFHNSVVDGDEGEPWQKRVQVAHTPKTE